MPLKASVQSLISRRRLFEDSGVCQRSKVLLKFLVAPQIRSHLLGQSCCLSVSIRTAPVQQYVVNMWRLWFEVFPRHASRVV
jgi:hypothetical protein